MTNGRVCRRCAQGILSDRMRMGGRCPNPECTNALVGPGPFTMPHPNRPESILTFERHRDDDGMWWWTAVR